MNKLWGAVIALLLVFCITMQGYTHERTDGGYYTLVDENGNTVYITGWGVDVGDQFLTENNKRYEVISISGDIAHSKFLGNVNLSKYANPEKNIFFSILHPSIAWAEASGKVAVYHTHSDESYVPTDGKDSILGAGGIYKVGNAFTSALQGKGLEVFHSEAKHDPHDNMAYERSRRTVTELLKKQPDAIFDIHRDAAPPEVYKGNIDGKDITKLQLVVGKYGPTGKQIEDYALQIKANSDTQHPGLIKGIFFAKGGDYNQDLHPRSMLLEVGSETNDRESAERGVALFADVIPTILGRTSASPSNSEGAAGVGTEQTGPSGASKAIGWIVGFLVVGVVAFLFLSTGSMKEAKGKLKQFTTTEFANFLGPKSKDKKDNIKPNHEKEKE
ncbi:stage II sporulation protein P [Pelosinus baikalensis]|uniref:Stage II sporulation protein P n=1 Tax=Pelosinus baikalensis TaxID=2892015 RepID=A0ABS8HMF4_9FIRM|nr:stage II sporulation protein P [Pelosinus baikalensis]MCC5464392.1 stage II sporulation protein P [Pelosinus baikalensis]